MPENWDDRAAFCLVCGASLEVREKYGAPRKCCTACDYVMFRSPACAAAVVVVRRRDVLLVRRGIEPYRGQWGLPGGFQDYWESAEEAAVREVREEAGIEVRLRRLLGVAYTTDDPRKRVNVVIYLGTPIAHDLRPGDDAVEARFFSIDHLPQPIAFANSRALLDGLREDFPTGDLR
ncbi:MAG: NUDIX domain-containing protein [Planctomycetota bacterium]